MSSSSSSSDLVIIIAGPTGVGKSDVAAKLCASSTTATATHHHHHHHHHRCRHHGMIVSADSVQAYRGVQIGANKPSPEERQETPHFLVDICDASEQYNAADWQRDAIFCIESLLMKKKKKKKNTNDANGATTGNSTDLMKTEPEDHPKLIQLEQAIAEAKRQKGYDAEMSLQPIVVGGTMMYLQWLVHGRPDAVRPSEEAIQRAQADIEKFQALPSHDHDDHDDGWKKAIEYVSSLNPIFEARVQTLGGQDWYRLRRTMEIAYTALDEKDPTIIESLYSGEREGGLDSFGYDVRCFFLCPNNRMEHTVVVDQRCEEMVIRGLILETTDLQLSNNLPDMATKAIGYRQALDYLNRPDAQLGDADALDAFLNEFTTATRRYAKKQMQWFRKDNTFAFVPVNLQDSKPERVTATANAVAELCQLSRQEYEEQLLQKDALGNVPLSYQTRLNNESQGKSMKYYQFKRYKLEKGSQAFQSVLEQADSCWARLKEHKEKESSQTDKRQRLI